MTTAVSFADLIEPGIRKMVYESVDTGVALSGRIERPSRKEMDDMTKDVAMLVATRIIH